MTLHTLSVLCMKMCIYSNIHVLSICDVILLICLQACYAALQGLRQLCKHCLKKDACYVQPMYAYMKEHLKCVLTLTPTWLTDLPVKH